MTILKIKVFPDPILRKKAITVNNVDQNIIQLLEDMTETMYKAQGMGLAANQVGELKRVIVVDCSSEKDDEKDINETEYSLIKMINPEIVSFSKDFSEYNEGCLSIPPYRASVSRPTKIETKYIDINGKEKKINASGILSTCIQHEIDHLNGKLFIDHISRLKRNMIIKKIKKKIKEDNNEI